MLLISYLPNKEEIEKTVNDLRKEYWEKGTSQEKNDTQDATSVHEVNSEMAMFLLLGQNILL